MAHTCELCDASGGLVVFSNAALRVVLVDDSAYPGFCRVIWNTHVKEMTDLDTADRASIMSAVWAVETAVREVMRPEKINIASLGNMTPHIHWHVIPRYADDVHFPSPVWATAHRDIETDSIAQRSALLTQLQVAIRRHLGADT